MLKKMMKILSLINEKTDESIKVTLRNILHLIYLSYPIFNRFKI